MVVLAAMSIFETARTRLTAEAISIRLIRPDEQGRRLIGLFQGSPAPHPAAALAAWKHATKGKISLGKATEAAIAAINPAMVDESKVLDGAEVEIGFGPDVFWRAVLPHDDGSLAALGVALALTDGKREESLGDNQVLRLGPPGAPLAASRPGRLMLASTRDGLRRALEPPANEDPEQVEKTSGAQVRVDPSGLRSLSSLNGRRLAVGLEAIGCREVRGVLALDDSGRLGVQFKSTLKPRPRLSTRLEPPWLDMIPARETVVAIATVIDGRPEALEDAFAAVDRVEKVDPARAGVAPARARLNLLAALAKVRLDVDVWPNLRGVTAAILADQKGEVSGAIVALHAVDEEVAGRLQTEVLPRLSAPFASAGKEPAEGPEGIRTLGRLDGKTLSTWRRGKSVHLAWSDSALQSAREAEKEPEQSAGSVLRTSWGATPPQRLGAFWLGRSARFAASSSTLARALNASPPIFWEGRTDERSSVDNLHWTGLKGFIRRWLESLPLETPPDH